MHTASVHSNISDHYHLHLAGWEVQPVNCTARLRPLIPALLHYTWGKVTSSPCNHLFLNLAVYSLVQATVGGGTVLVWDFCVASTRGGRGTITRPIFNTLPCTGGGGGGHGHILGRQNSVKGKGKM